MLPTRQSAASFAFAACDKRPWLLAVYAGRNNDEALSSPDGYDCITGNDSSTLDSMLLPAGYVA